MINIFDEFLFFFLWIFYLIISFIIWNSQILLLLPFIILSIVSLIFGFAMSAYVKDNRLGYGPEVDKIASDLRDELVEFKIEIESRNVIGMIKEFSDVQMCFIKFILIKYFYSISYFKSIWAILFYLNFVTNIKSVFRYIRYGCIRNHARLHLMHSCRFNNLLKRWDIPQENNVKVVQTYIDLYRYDTSNDGSFVNKKCSVRGMPNVMKLIEDSQNVNETKGHLSNRVSDLSLKVKYP